MLSFITWNVNPAWFHFPDFIPLLGGREVRWYGLLFAVGFAIGAYIVHEIWKKEKLKEEWFDKLFVYVFVATAVGARLGHCLFYNPGYYLAHPVEILKIWEGGLASHGGTLGIIIAVYFYSKKITHQSMLWTFDRLVVPVGLVAAFIRMGNLMNSEVFGRPTGSSWGFRFVRSVEWSRPPISAAPCHPTQLYEAFCYLITFAICMWLYWKKDAQKKEGFLFGIFLTGIFLSRFFIEFLKNNQEDFEAGMLLNMGQLLSIPFVVAGLFFVWRAMKRDKYPRL
ncbi:MAG: prolipoprotein diacylglyceryl transferase [Dysgonamonadaceae bacterium]|jgi:prolipoprotein diacylglyceryl transferase|nr:prolipoprotein diacylglyceryl transferase [Dysgonamonadaceae bacterium]